MGIEWLERTIVFMYYACNDGHTGAVLLGRRGSITPFGHAGLLAAGQAAAIDPSLRFPFFREVGQ